MGLIDIVNPIGKPIRFTIPLKFLEEDIRKYPWLSEPDRYYVPEKSLDQGGFSTPFLGHPCRADGTIIPGSDTVVIKIPNLAPDRKSDDIAARLRYIQAHSITEWSLIRKKLMGCKHANPIFDLGSVWTDNPLTEMIVTVQPYLSGATSLKHWLVKRGMRQKISRDPQGREINDWTGLSEWNDWLNLAKIIGHAIFKVHQCRVIHGDIWPPNIFITEAEPSCAILIDFGESFGVVPTGETREQPNHPYRAPERTAASEYVSTDQIDVYSFGKLLLYLAIGRDERIPPNLADGGLLYGHRRRSYVRELLFRPSAHNLAADHPEILDIISQCTALDPVDRPTMIEVSDQLQRLDASPDNRPFNERLTAVATDANSRPHQVSKVFGRFIDKKIQEVERLIESSETEMVEIRGSRDILIDALVTLFDELNNGDSWTTLTTPAVWQRSALGLDGRYATATVKAVHRGAAVHRAYAISIEEFGSKWAKSFAECLQNTGDPLLKPLSEVFTRAVLDFDHHASTSKGYKRRTDTDPVLKAHQERFVCILESLVKMKRYCDISKFLHADDFSKIGTTNGLYLGLVPVATEAKKRELKTKHATSLMYLGKEPKEHDRWLLVMTDIRGRNEYEANPAWPQLLGVRVYKSVMGYPKNRVIEIEELMRSSFNIGGLVEMLADCAATASQKH